MTDLVRTKLIIPLADQNLVMRPRLTDWLNAGANCALTLVSAPAGSGKSTLLSEWARGHDRPVAWISLDRRDNDPARFNRYLVEALQDHGLDLPDCSSPDPESLQDLLESTLITVINRLVEGRLELVLVLDDYHLIENTAIHAALIFCVENLPTGARLILSTRADPPFPLSRLRARGQLAELRFENLRFTPQEAAAFLQVSGAGQLEAQDVSSLINRTEGWVSGLKLAALSLQRSPDPHLLVESFTGSHRYVLDYLVDEVLDRQPPQVQNFLLETSILEQLNGPLCSAVTLQPDGEAMLAALERHNLFLIPLDQNRHWYRYHHLFAEALRDRLAQRSPGRLHELHRRASAWYAQMDLPADAIDHVLAAGQPHQAAALIERFAEGFWMSSQVVSLLRWIQAIPLDARRTHPRLSLWEAWMLLLTGDWSQVDAILDAVEERLAAGNGQSSQRRDPEAGELKGMLAAVRAFRANTSANPEEAMDAANQALDTLSKDSLNWRAAAAHILADSYRLQGDLPAASRAYTKAVEAGRKAGNVFSVLVSLRYQAEMQVQTGGLQQAEIMFKKALRYARQYKAEGLSAAGTVQIGLGSLHYQKGEHDRARRHLEEGLAVCEMAGHGIGLVLANCALARLCHAAGEDAEAQRRLDLAKGYVESHQLKQLDWYPQCLRALFHLDHAMNGGPAFYQTQVGLVESWAAGAGLKVDQDPRPLNLPNLVYARLLVLQGITKGEFAPALNYLDAILQAATSENKPGYRVEAWLLRARALRRREDKAGSMRALVQALEAGVEGGFLQAFLNEGEEISELLRDLLVVMPEHPAAGFATQVLKRFGIAHEEPESVLDKLFSPREIEVIHLMAQGFTNRQIAKKLVVAESTVKTHLGRIYRRLKVSNRTQAVHRLQSLNLLELT